MPDRKKMYAILCAAASDAVDRLVREGKCLDTAAKLQLALLEAEEVYLQAPDPRS